MLFLVRCQLSLSKTNIDFIYISTVDFKTNRTGKLVLQPRANINCYFIA